MDERAVRPRLAALVPGVALTYLGRPRVYTGTRPAERPPVP
ncbi:hypothetical protein [Streptomyces goshikiensis]